MNLRKYSDKDYSNAYYSLNNEQRLYIDDFVKVGYKTKWLHTFAKNKGLIIDQSKVEYIDELEDLVESEELIEKIEWLLIDYTDHYKINKEVRCECGRPLRHEYNVSNIATGKMYTLGIDHLKQYTNLDESDVKEIVKNLRVIDLEKKEILEKVIEGRDINLISKINKDVIYPKNIEMHIQVKLPLLDRQIKRLEKLGAFSDYNYESEKTEQSKTRRDINRNSNLGLQAILTSKNITNKPVADNTLSKPEFKVDINEMLKKLRNRGFSIEESEKYLISLKYYEDTIDPLSIDKNEIEILFKNAFRKVGLGDLRNKLIDIEALFKRIHARQYRKK